MTAADADPTGRAADLVELMLEQISRTEQDWHLIAVLARELADLAGRAAGWPDPVADAED